MATPTYTPLQTITLGSSASSVTFASIPQTYRDLVMVANIPSLSGTPVSASGRFTVNGTSGTTVYMQGTGSSAVSGAPSYLLFPVDNAQGVYILQFMDYSATDKHKTILSRANVATANVHAMAHRYASTSAITSITLTAPDTGGKTYSAGSTFSLYGILGEE